MNLKKNIFISLLLSIGFIFSQITPPLLGGMRFDFLLSFIFIAIILTRDFKSTLLIGLLGGFLSALSSTFPGGQIANILDKFIVSIYIFILLKIFDKLDYKKLFFISITGTFLSGVIFLFIASLLIQLPLEFKKLLITIVLPATLFNGIGTVILFKIIKRSLIYINLDLK